MMPTFLTVSSQRKYTIMMAALKIEPLSREELEAKMICSRTRATEMLRVARQAGDVRVVRWLRTRGGFFPIYGLGPGKDAPKPLPETTQQRHAKRMADKVAKSTYNMKLAAMYRKRRQTKYPNMHANALEAVQHLRNGGTPDIARQIGLAYSTAFCALRELEEEGKVMRTSKPGAMPIRWAIKLETAEVPEDLPKQAVVKGWKAPKVSQQNAFSALFF